MISIKSLFDAIEPCDGQRIWVEPIGVTRELRQLCRVDHVLSHLGPPMKLWEWFQEHPDGYEYVRAQYHAHLDRGPYKPALQQLACVALNEDFTLLHQGDDPEQNSATALYEYLSELEAYCPKDPE